MAESPEKVAARILAGIEDKGSRATRLFLQGMQKTLNWVPPESIEVAAAHFGISASEIVEVACLQPGISLEKQGEVLIEVCRGHACGDAESAEVLKDYENCLGLKEGQTAENGSHSLKAVYCFGRCAIGPNVRINGEFYSNQVPGEAKKKL